MAGNFIRKSLRFLLISINLLVGIGLCLACYGNKMNQEKFWYVSLANMATFFLLALLLFFLVFWLLVNRKWTWISIIFILICWGPLKNVVRWRFAKPFSYDKAPQDLRIMTWNVELFGLMDYKKHPEVKDSIINSINHYNPDIACFQEMTCSDSFPSATNYLPKIAEQIKMPYYHYAYKSKFNFDKKNHFGIIIFSKYPIVRKEMLYQQPLNYNEIFQYADIVKNQDTIRVFNLHLQTLKFDKENRNYLESPTMDDKNDIKNSKNVLHKIKKSTLLHKTQSDRVRQEIEKSPFPVIVCGDFNDVPNSYAYATIGKDLKNVFREKGYGMGRTFTGISPTLRIDNIFCDQRFQVRQYDRMGKKFSDHFPVISDVFLSPSITP